jgi:hypothetical protein
MNIEDALTMYLREAIQQLLFQSRRNTIDYFEDRGIEDFSVSATAGLLGVRWVSTKLVWPKAPPLYPPPM